MKFPEDVRKQLIRYFQNRNREWLSSYGEGKWPLEIALGIPSEQLALRQLESVRAWVVAWQTWTGGGIISWCERHWKSLGVQRLPAKLILQRPEDVAMWIGENNRWQLACTRYQTLAARWPALVSNLSRHFDVLADYSESDFQHLFKMLEWITTNPDSNLYTRQLPVAGLDSKWIEKRKGLLTELVATIQGNFSNGLNFYKLCGLKPLPKLIRIRVLDKTIRNLFGGISDITAPVEELAKSNLPVSRVFIIENLQSGLALPDMPKSVAVMGLGYHVDVLVQLPWVCQASCIYWGDLDTHGFSILHRARSYLQKLQSVLMDEDTLFCHRALWVLEKEQHAAAELSFLTKNEQDVYLSLKQQRWGHNVRLEQERIAWDYALEALQRLR